MRARVSSSTAAAKNGPLDYLRLRVSSPRAHSRFLFNRRHNLCGALTHHRRRLEPRAVTVTATPETEMDTAEEAGQELVSAVGEDSIPEAAACSREERKEEEEEEVEVSFDELGLDEQLKRALRKKGILKATPIQREAIPLILVRGLWLSSCF